MIRKEISLYLFLLIFLSSNLMAMAVFKYNKNNSIESHVLDGDLYVPTVKAASISAEHISGKLIGDGSNITGLGSAFSNGWSVLSPTVVATEERALDNVAIGVATAKGRLHVNGDVKLDDSNNKESRLIVEHNGTNTLLKNYVGVSERDNFASMKVDSLGLGVTMLNASANIEFVAGLDTSFGGFKRFNWVSNVNNAAGKPPSLNLMTLDSGFGLNLVQVGESPGVFPGPVHLLVGGNAQNKNLKASSFEGDGSALTNLPPASTPSTTFSCGAFFSQCTGSFVCFGAFNSATGQAVSCNSAGANRYTCCSFV